MLSKRWFATAILSVSSIVAYSGLERVTAQEEVGPSVEKIVESGKEALRRASAMRRSSFKKDAEEKRRILLQAVEVYRTIVAQFANEPRTASEAALRAGDVCRSLDLREEALALYESVLTFPETGRMGARALTEIGHISRRAQRFDDAIRSYRGVVDRFSNEMNEVGQALVWIGKVEKQRADSEKARAAWRELIERCPRPATRVVQAFDLLAQSYLDGADPAGARRVIEDCRTRFADSLTAKTRDAQRITKAMNSMKSMERLRKAEAKPVPEVPTEPDQR